MKDNQRALRRHHVARLKHKRRSHCGRDIRHDPRLVGKAVNSPCLCSCWMCGNPRKYFGLLSKNELRDQPSRLIVAE